MNVSLRSPFQFTFHMVIGNLYDRGPGLLPSISPVFAISPLFLVISSFPRGSFYSSPKSLCRLMVPPKHHAYLSDWVFRDFLSCIFYLGIFPFSPMILHVSFLLMPSPPAFFSPPRLSFAPFRGKRPTPPPWPPSQKSSVDDVAVDGFSASLDD